MVRIAAGAFSMGAIDGYADERPVHHVDVAAFCIDVEEVTARAYGRCVAVGKCSRPATDALCNTADAAGAQPVNCVSWEQARGYCTFANERLLTEEEWEYAGRGADGRAYPWGSEAPADRPCWKRAFNAGTCPVGSKARDLSPFGVRDMAGNLAEWTASEYSLSYVAPRARGRHVYRGGAWLDAQEASLRATRRSSLGGGQRSDQIGLRCGL